MCLNLTLKKGQAYTIQPDDEASDTERMGQDGLVISEETQFANSKQNFGCAVTHLVPFLR